MCPSAREIPKILELPCNISATAGTNDLKFGAQVGFAKAHHKITPIVKSGHGFGLAKLPYIWGSPLILLQRPRCPLSVSRASNCFF